MGIKFFGPSNEHFCLINLSIYFKRYSFFIFVSNLNLTWASLLGNKSFGMVFVNLNFLTIMICYYSFFLQDEVLDLDALN